MKILHIAFSGLGGHGSVFFSMADADVDKRHQLEVIFFGNETVVESYIEKVKQRNIPWHFVKKRPGFDFGAYRQIESIIRQTKPDILFLHSSSYIFPARKALLFNSKKTKLIVRESHANHLKSRFEWLGLVTALLVAQKVIFLSTEYRDYIKKKFRFIFRDKKTAVIPNGINLELYKPAVKQDGASINIGMQSRLTAIKDLHTLIDAFAVVLKSGLARPVKLYIAGDGACKTALEKQVSDLHIENDVAFTGMLEEASLPAFINSLDIYVHATLGETMSTAIMQVMACMLPIIASDVPGVNNMIRHEQNGLLVPVKNVQALSEAMIRLLNDKELAAALAANAYTFAKDNYSNKKMLQRYNEIFYE